MKEEKHIETQEETVRIDGLLLPTDEDMKQNKKGLGRNHTRKKSHQVLVALCSKERGQPPQGDVRECLEK